MTDDLVPITEAADVLHVHRATLYREIGARRIRLTKIRGRSFILGSEIERLSKLLPREEMASTEAPEGRRPPGAGSVAQDLAGRWIAKIYLRDHRRVVRARPTRELAEKALAEILQKHRDELGVQTYRRYFQPDLVARPWPREKHPRSGVSPRRRWLVLERDGHRCVYCGATPADARLVVDHIVPVAAGGSDELDNLTTACTECNAGKAALPLRVVG